MEEPSFSKEDLAKYPFMPQAARFVKELDLEIDELRSDESTISETFKSILDRAEKRVEEAIISAKVNREIRIPEKEIPSFPIAIMMVVAMEDSFTKKRYALAEAKSAYEQLEKEKTEKIFKIAKHFKWKITPIQYKKTDVRIYDFMLHFTDFLKNSTNFHETEWKLVNRPLVNGTVYIKKKDADRLLQEEIRRYIEEKLNTKVSSLPPNIMSRIERLKQLFIERKGKGQFEELPKKVIIIAFPPCIKELYDATTSGHHISHIGRFALTSFLVSIGMTPENVTDLFRSFSDFNEKMTRYQVEHIAGERGTRTKYLPPRCDTLRTHGVCHSTEEDCRRIRHPLTYYKRKLGKIRIETKEGSGNEEKQ
jgi:DNA primase large subunit